MKAQILIGLAVTGLCLAGGARGADAPSAPIMLNIEAQPMEDALNQFAQQSGLQVLISSEDAPKGMQAPRMVGEFTADAALKRMLAESGLRYEFVNERTVAVRVGREGRTSRAGYDGSLTRVAQKDPQASTQIEMDEDKGEGLQEIIVTGTHIRGARNAAGSLRSYDREAIDKTGATNTQDFIRTIPQNFNGGSLGASESGRLGPGESAQSNNEAATGVNLRGLGNNSTLTLLNGHRMAPSAFGGIVDVSMIPLSVVERVEVLTDGASAIYGTDAIAGVVNFILRKDFDGAESEVRYGAVSEGHLEQRTVSQTFGQSWDSGGVLASLQYNQQESMPTSERGRTAEAPQPNEIFPEYKKYNVLLDAHQRISDRLDIFGDFLGTRNDGLRKSSPREGFRQIQKNRNDAMSLHAGVGYASFSDWRVEASGTISQQDLDVRLLEDQPPQPGYALGTIALANKMEVVTADVKADGSILSLPGGRAKAAVGASYREEDLDSLIPYQPLELGARSYHRKVDSAFAEIYAPVIGYDNAKPLIHRLDLSAALRYDDYSDFGSTTNPKLSVSWAPIDALTVQASWSTSYRAPIANELLNQRQFGGIFVFNVDFDNPAGPGTVPVFYVGGTSQLLTPEKSRNWSAAVDYRFESLPRAGLSLGYYHIDYRDRIFTPPFDSSALQRPEVFGSLVTVLADDTAAAAYLADFEANGYMNFADPTGVRYVYFAAEQNAARVVQSGFDLTGSRGFDAGQHRFDVRFNAAWIDRIDTSFTTESAATDLVDTYANPLRFRLRGDLAWTYREWSLNTAVNYSNGYSDTTITPSGNIPAWTTVDFTMRFRPDLGNALLRGASVGLNVINIFDAKPPFVEGGALTGIHYDVDNADVRGRFLSISVQKTW